jgi:hypothetical protein
LRLLALADGGAYDLLPLFLYEEATTLPEIPAEKLIDFAARLSDAAKYLPEEAEAETPGVIRFRDDLLGMQGPGKVAIRPHCPMTPRRGPAPRDRVVQAGRQIPATGMFGHLVQTATLPGPWLGMSEYFWSILSPD